ncbi:hypothetical protein HHI36_013872 [Cryptolaemus montrouzieri]|uniref:Uncharacterized protein n=1 Tax=Cryptolaemus montrouzieri TaxID=559131 RepID=A0ABD2N164_9CUCU
MYAAAGGASLASRQARQRQRQNKQKTQRLHQAKAQNVPEFKNIAAKHFHNYTDSPEPLSYPELIGAPLSLQVKTKDDIVIRHHTITLVERELEKVLRSLFRYKIRIIKLLVYPLLQQPLFNNILYILLRVSKANFHKFSYHLRQKESQNADVAL